MYSFLAWLKSKSQAEAKCTQFFWFLFQLSLCGHSPSSFTAFLKEEPCERRERPLFCDSSVLRGFPLSAHTSTPHTQGRARDYIAPSSPLKASKHPEMKTSSESCLDTLGLQHANQLGRSHLETEAGWADLLRGPRNFRPSLNSITKEC